MNKKDVVTRENITKVADFLKKACDYFKTGGDGCFHYNLSEDLAIYVGWSDGYDPADDTVIKSFGGQKESDRTSCWAVNAAVKVRNDFDCTDFDCLDYPYYKDGECWDNGISISPEETDRGYRDSARWLLQNYVTMTNLINKGKLLTGKA